MKEVLLEVNNLEKTYITSGGLLGREKKIIKAIDNISFKVLKGETFGLVGESGCGKSTTGKGILRLIDNVKGEIIFQGRNINSLSKKEMKNIRPEMQMIFQDPYSSLNPKRKIVDIIGEGICENSSLSKKEVYELVESISRRCGIDKDSLEKYPHEFSGGQRQRIGIARGISLNPKLIIADEPVSALDISMQSQIINLMLDIQEERNISYIFISHDLNVVRFVANKIGVMYLGSIVELGDKDEIFNNTLHPYTKGLIEAIPSIYSNSINEIKIRGDIDNSTYGINGCRFKNRCPYRSSKCEEEPTLKQVNDNHLVACHLY